MFFALQSKLVIGDSAMLMSIEAAGGLACQQQSPCVTARRNWQASATAAVGQFRIDLCVMLVRS
jgi:hypothetical protein